MQTAAMMPSKANCVLLPGEVKAGQHFVAPIAPGLFFHLVSQGDDGIINGWAIEVRSSSSAEEGQDFSRVVTPPFRFDNPLNVDTSYGKRAEMWTQGSVAGGQFVINEAEFRRAWALLQRVLWPQSLTDYEKALAEADSVPTGNVELRVLKSRTTPPSPEHELGTIDYLAFEVTACLPK